QTIAVAYRMPANVVGDGKKNINELINDKNIVRGEDYTHPLLKIKIDYEVERHLKEQKLNLESVPKSGERIFLRKNSNLSTGGDSIDLTDDMPDFYKKIAEKAARAAGLKIAGIDIIIKNIHKTPNHKNYIVVELNAPAMLSMHDYPYVGKNRNVARYVVDSILNSK
ncbi:MAG: bifunctional glutamate--cysteine ligase GshA/glutathione synthetase GshB, partial [Bacteroidales bacterium]|nr:bifunctional glutamate--cysteine ligase GshA/glutathione synthetase GshB [Bacteroidales bacterium]